MEIPVTEKPDLNTFFQNMKKVEPTIEQPIEKAQETKYPDLYITPISENEPKTPNLIDMLSKTINDGIDSNPDWVESLATSLVATVAGNTILFSDSIGKIQSNVFFVFIGSSSQSKKSAPLNQRARPILEQVQNRINAEVYKRYGFEDENDFMGAVKKMGRKPVIPARVEAWEKENEKLEDVRDELVDYLTPTKFTREALTSWLIKHPNGLIAHDEFTSILTDATNKEYMKTILEFLSSLYDNQINKTTTIKRGVENPKNLHVSFVSCTTPIFFTLCADTTPFKQGYSNRILFIYDTKVDIKTVEEERQQAGVFFLDSAFRGKLDTEECVEGLLNIRNLHNKGIIMTDDTQLMIDIYDFIAQLKVASTKAIAEDQLNIIGSYYSRMIENYLKLIMLRTIGRYALLPESEHVVYMETKREDYLWAREKATKHLDAFNRIATELKLASETPLKSYTGVEAIVLQMIDNGGGCTTIAQICGKLGWMRKDLQPTLDEMLLTDRIRIAYDVINPQTGRLRNEIRRGKHK